jgi:hypothetical protein
VEWINVKDRLPGVGDAVLACHRLPTKKFDSEWWFGCCVYREYGFPWVKLDDANPVEFWMPIPTPPEGE